MIKHNRWKILLQLIIVSIVAGCGYVTEEEYLPRYFNDSENPYISDIYPPEGSTLNSLEYIDVTYSEPVLGADVLNNYTLNGSGLGSLSISNITNLSDNKYRISLSGSPSDGEVTLTINNITDLNENLLSEEVFTYQIDLTGPTVLATPTSGSKVDSLTQIDLQYSETVIGADVLNNYSLSGSGIGTLALSSVTEIGVNKYRLTLTGVPGDSQIMLTISNVYDGVGNALSGNTINYTGWWNAGWQYRRKLVFDNSGQTENLVDFPVLVKLNSSRIDYSSTQDNGEDIRFVDPDGTVLSYEIESWDESGASIVWVKVPQIDGGSTTDYIWMYYGNSSATDWQNAADVWSSTYKGIWHLNESSGGPYNDSTGNGYTGIAEGTVVRIDNGVVGGAQDFDADSDRISMSINIGSIITISAWGKLDTQGDMLWCVGTGTSGYDLWFTNNNIYLNVWSGTNSPFYPQPSGVNQWHYYVVVINSLSSQTLLYIDGQFAGQLYYPNRTGNIIYIGSSSTSYTWNGSVDEFRISDKIISADWIAAQYLSMNDTFVTFGAEE